MNKKGKPVITGLLQGPVTRGKKAGREWLLWMQWLDSLLSNE
jgi:hypothetical protein